MASPIQSRQPAVSCAVTVRTVRAGADTGSTVTARYRLRSPVPDGETPRTGSGPHWTKIVGLPGFTTVPSAVRSTVTHQSWQKAPGLPMFCHCEKNSVWTFDGVAAGGAQFPLA